MRYTLNNNDAVAHAWANQTQTHAKCGNVSFEGVYFYSYNTPIAKLHTVNGQKVAIVTSTFYSNTTCKHIRSIEKACTHIEILRCKDGLEDIFSALLEEQDTYINWLFDVFSKRKVSPYFTKNLVDSVSFFNERCEKYGHPELKLDINDEYVALVEGFTSQLETVTKQKEELRRIEKEKKALEYLETWKQGGEYNHILTNIKPQLIRVKNNEVQTSGGASVPLVEAKKLLALIDDRLPVVGLKISGFEIKDINDNTITIGCHTLNINQCREVLK